MPQTTLSKLESKVMNLLWEAGEGSVRQLLERFVEKDRPAYTTVQTILYRLEDKGAVRRTKKIGNAHIFEPVGSQAEARKSVVADLLELFGGRAQPLVSHLIESGDLTLEDIEAARETLRDLGKKD